MLPKKQSGFIGCKRFTNWTDYFECWWCQISKQNVSRHVEKQERRG
jgi:hypothetical protein